MHTIGAPAAKRLRLSAEFSDSVKIEVLFKIKGGGE
ncbi:hypothetical protein GGR27_002931 [Lewinella antarctica]|uniref:Uncharacterized protein n=1 Tax=Neolewinella antarctica TaxID=442734 RepID=A0ABX0XDM9_9BACT|nr:hypothetical protein [Neolewinella antarctica]